MVSRKTSTTLGDDVWMWNIILIGCINKGVNTVVDVFLDAIVNRTFATCRTSTIVVDT